MKTFSIVQISTKNKIIYDTGSINTKSLGQFRGIVAMALAKYDLPTKPTNIGMFCLGFLGICWQEVISAKDCWQYWLTPTFYLTKVYFQQISTHFCREMLANLLSYLLS